ncbi:hypothetical protein IAD21_00934 [Abditibacteriota bacterium]|nr:hypothetical protein IAD21_00934 [Abditibacteriota bacterium]
MKDRIVLVFNKKGFERAYKTAPVVKPSEVAIEISIEVADALFQRPQLRATLKVDESAGTKFELTPAMLSDMTQAVKIGTGMDVVIEMSQSDT